MEGHRSDRPSAAEPSAGVPAAFAGGGLLESVVHNATDAVVITEFARGQSEPRIVYVNPAFTTMTGYSADDVFNKSPRMLHGPGTSPASEARIRDAIAKSRPLTVDLLTYRKDGSEYRVELAMSPVADETGAFAHWLTVQRDITQCGPSLEPAQAREALLTELKERERVEARLAYNELHDELTGLYNHAYFMKRLASAIARAREDSTYAFAVVYLDLDRFRLVNEHLGHRSGDRILRDLARRFERCVDSRNTLARIGGDEFGLLLEGSEGLGGAVNTAQALLVELAQRPRFGDDDAMIAASIGIVESAPGIEDAQSLMRDATIALALARQTAGSSYVVFSPEMHAQAAAVARLRSDLYGAVERGELRLYYQPLVDIAMGRIYGFEGLVRWQHPTRGLISPDDFIPAAEETGIIIELGRWVLLEGCRKAREFAAIAGRPLLMSLNVSSQQLVHPHFLGHLLEALETTGIDACTLQLEITESVFLAGGNVIGALFSRIRALGIQIAFDDFGTGYSSLSYLERFQIDTLKIDRSFVARIHDASSKSEILRMIIALAHALGVDIVAEGVETRAQRDALGHLGCTHLQGYLFSRPLPEAGAKSVLEFDGHAELDTLLEETLTDAGGASLSAAQRSELRSQVEAAIETHHLWLGRLHAAVATGESPFDPAQVAREDVCPIGVWLHTTISEKLRDMPLYHVTKSRHAVFHRSMARLFAAVSAGQSEAALSLRPDGDVTMVGASLLRTLHDWLAVAAADETAGAANRLAFTE